MRVVAHRAGNDLDRARAAAAAGLVVEVDVHVFHNRLEVRHEKVLRPSGRLWEPWYLLPRDTPRLERGSGRRRQCLSENRAAQFAE